MEKQIKELRRMKRLLKEGRDSDVRGYHMPVATREASTHPGRARAVMCVCLRCVCCGQVPLKVDTDDKEANRLQNHLFKRTPSVEQVVKRLASFLDRKKKLELSMKHKVCARSAKPVPGMLWC